MKALALIVVLGACASEPATLESGSYRVTLTTNSACPTLLPRDQTWDIAVQFQNYSILDVVDTSRAYTVYEILTDTGQMSGGVNGDAEIVQLQGWGGDEAMWTADLQITNGSNFDGWLDVTSSDCGAQYHVLGTR